MKLATADKVAGTRVNLGGWKGRQVLDLAQNKSLGDPVPGRALDSAAAMSGTQQEGPGPHAAPAQEGQRQGQPAEQKQHEQSQEKAGEEGAEVDYISPAQVDGCRWSGDPVTPAHTKELARQAAAQR